MVFMDYIVQRLNDASSWFYEAYLEVNGWIYPFWLLAHPLYMLSTVFNRLAWDFSDFFSWLLTRFAEIGDVLSWGTIKSYILSWIPNLEAISDWFTGWYDRVAEIVDAWWLATSTTVQGWIDVARQFLQDQLDSLNTWLGSLQSDWDSFWTITWPEWTGNLSELRSTWDNFVIVILPALVTGSQVDDLITSKLTEWLPFYDDLVSLWGDIKLFFSDPLTWLEQRFTDWFLGAG